MAEKPCHAIREVKKYVDPDGREVLEFVQVFGKNESNPIVKGAVIVRVGMSAPGMPMRQQDMRLEFLFEDGVTVKKAFEIFDTIAQGEVDRWKKEQDEKAKDGRIVGARAMPGLNLLGPNGRPMKG